VLALKRVSLPAAGHDQTQVDLTLVKSPKQIKNLPQVIPANTSKNSESSSKDSTPKANQNPRKVSADSTKTSETALPTSPASDVDVKSLLRSAGDSILLMVPVNKVELRFDSKLVKIDFTILGSDGQVTKVDEYYTADMKETVQFLNTFYGLQNRFQQYYFPGCSFKR
jgi:hypothetical protein